MLARSAALRTATWEEVLEYGAELPRGLRAPIGGGSGYSSIILADGPVSYYTLTEAVGSATVADSADANTGTINGIVTLGQPGALITDAGTSALFNGTTGFIDLGTGANLSITGNISLEAWFQVSGALSVSDILVGKSLSTSGYFLRLNATPNVITGFGNGTVTTNSQAFGTFATGWHHAVGTWDGSNIRVYVDGTLRGGPTAFAGPIATAAANAKLGASGTAGANFFPGFLAHCAIYNTVLTGQQVLNHYNAGATGGFAPRRMPLGV